MKVIYTIPLKEIKYFFLACGNRTLIAHPDDIISIFTTYNEAFKRSKGCISEDGPAIYVPYKNKLLLVFGVDTDTNELKISEEYLMEKCSLGMEKIKKLIKENT